MSEKKFQITKDDSIEITVPRKKRRDIFVPDDNPKGIIQTRRLPDYLPRRLQKKTGIRFFDLGVLANKTDITFSIPSNYDVSNENTFQTDSGISDIKLLEAFILSEGVENLTTKYWQIDSDAGAWLNFTIYSDTLPAISTATDEKWGANGVWAVSSENLADGHLLADSQNLFWSIRWRGDYKNKITETGDYSGSEVTEFDLDKNAVIFWMPLLTRSYCVGLADGIPGGRESLFSDLQLAPRVPLLFDSESEFYKQIRISNWSKFSSTIDDYEDVYMLIRYVKQYGLGLRYFFNPGDYSAPERELPPAGFPNQENFPAAAPGANSFSLQSGLQNQTIRGTQLVAIIYQNKQFYYVWERIGGY